MNYSNVVGFIIFSTYIIQFAVGILLVAYYSSIYLMSFDSVMYIMIEVMMGFMIRFIHCVMATAMICGIYIHLFRGIWLRLLYLDSLSSIYLTGIVLFGLSIVEGFFGYILNFGQMSYWGYMVLLGLFTVLGIFQWLILELLWCSCYVVLYRVLLIHFLVGWIIGIMVILHIIVLHSSGSVNPLLQSYSSSLMSFFSVIFKDILILLFASTLVWWLLFSHPDSMGNADNLIQANPLSTPDLIVPEFYFLVIFYLLRCIAWKVLGILVVVSTICAILL